MSNTVLIFLQNCDVPMLGDVESTGLSASGAGTPAPGSMGCTSAWTLSLSVEDQASTFVLPIVSVAPTGCAAQPGGGCERASSAEHSAATLPGSRHVHHINVLPIQMLTLPAASSMCQQTAAQLVHPLDHAAQEACAQLAVMFHQRHQAGSHRRRTQHGHGASINSAHVVVTMVEYHAPSREQALHQQQLAQASHCLRHGIQLQDCPGVPSTPHTHNGRRLLAKLGPSAAPLGAAQQPGGSATEAASEGDECDARVQRVDSELQKLRKQLSEVMLERDRYLNALQMVMKNA